MSTKKIKLLLSILLPICIFLTIIIIIAKHLPDYKLISTKTYDIYELTLDDTRIYYSYIDENQKINKNYEEEYYLIDKIYLGEKNQVAIENWGFNGKPSSVELIKFYVDEKTYKNFSEKYDWETENNMGSH